MPVMTQHKTIQEQVNELKTSTPTLEKVVQTSGLVKNYVNEIKTSMELGKTPIFIEPTNYVLIVATTEKSFGTFIFGYNNGVNSMGNYGGNPLDTTHTLTYWKVKK